MDKYDVEVERLQKVLSNHGGQEFRHEVMKAWCNPFELGPGCLFQRVGPDDRKDAQGRPYGCLTQVRAGSHGAVPECLGEAVRNDERVPGHPSLVTAESLAVFAEYQRKADQYCNGGE